MAPHAETVQSSPPTYLAPVKAKTTTTVSSQTLIDCENQYAAKGLKSVPVVISRALGARMWDMEGKEYIDFLSSFSVVNQGHCHPRIIKRMIEQSQKVTLTSRAYHNEHYPLLCKRLCELLEYDLAFAMNSGSEAVETGIKIARKWGYNVKGIPSDQALVLTIKDNYHGKTMGPLSASSTEYIRRDFGPFVPGVSPSIDGRLIRWNNLEDLEWAFQQKGNTLAALMIECVQGHAGCLPCSDEYLQGASELCKRYRVLLIADEIQSGFGRTGHLMAYQAARIRPDMVTLGKAMTGGVIPMSMVVGTRECMGQLQYGEHSSTYSSNPLASAVALEAIQVILDEKLSERSLELGQRLKQRLASIKSPYAMATVTGRGLFCAFTIDESHPSGRVTASRLCNLMKQRGVLCYANGSRIRIAPPLVIEEDLLWSGVDILEKSLNDLVNIDGDID